MAITVGSKIPSAKCKRITADGIDDVDAAEALAGKKVVLFAVPGAFTGTCSNVHLPGYVARADELRAKGASDVVCLAVNDAAVMNAWAKEHDAIGKVTMLCDGNAELAKAMGLELDLSVACMGIRTKRFSMVIENGVVKSLEIEPNAGEVAVSGAESCLSKL